MLSPFEISCTVGDTRQCSELTSVKEYKGDQRKRERGLVCISSKQQEKRGCYFITGVSTSEWILLHVIPERLLKSFIQPDCKNSYIYLYIYLSQKFSHTAIKYFIVRETSNSFYTAGIKLSLWNLSSIKRKKKILSRNLIRKSFLEKFYF